MDKVPTTILRGHPTRVIGVGFGLAIALMLMLAVATLMRLDALHESLKEVERHAVRSELANRMYNASRERVYLLVQAAHESDPFIVDQHILRFGALGASFCEVRKTLLEEDLTTDERDLVKGMDEEIAGVLPFQDRPLELALSGDHHAAMGTLLKEVLPGQEKILLSLNKLVEMQGEEVVEDREAVYLRERQAYFFLFAGAVAVALFSLFIAFFVHRHLSGLLSRLADTSTQLKSSLRDLEFQKLALDEHAIVSISDAQGIITYVNDRFCAISQYAAEELLGHDHRIVKSGLHPPEFFGEMWRTMAAGEVWHGHMCNRRKDGSLYWADTTILPFVGEEGRPYQ